MNPSINHRAIAFLALPNACPFRFAPAVAGSPFVLTFGWLGLVILIIGWMLAVVGVVTIFRWALKRFTH